jgi:outer membrane lipoprotein-sorting protein
VNKVTLFDAAGNTTAISLSQLRLNTGIDDQQFRFVPPAGINVVTPGKP